MPVTDLSQFPWLRQQAGPQGGPGAAPQGAGAGWLQYLSQMFGQGGDPANMPSPDAAGDATGDQRPYQTASLGWTGSPTYDQAAALQRHLVSPASTYNASNPPPNPNPPGPGNVNVVGHGDGPAPVPPFPVPPGPQQGPPGYLGSSDAAGGVQAASIGPQAPPGPQQGPPGYAGSSDAAGGVPVASMGLAAGVQPGISAPAMVPPSVAGGRPTTPGVTPSTVKGPLAVHPAVAAAAAAQNPRFGLISHDVSGGGRTPYISALNLAGLFGGGGQAPANPANAPSAAAQPVSATRRVPGPLATTKAPWGYGPLQKGRSWPQGPDLPVGWHSGYQ